MYYEIGMGDLFWPMLQQKQVLGFKQVCRKEYILLDKEIPYNRMRRRRKMDGNHFVLQISLLDRMSELGKKYFFITS